MRQINLKLISKNVIKKSFAYLLMFAMILQNLNFVNASSALGEQHTLVKRMDIETCLVRFDVHLNTIIRTEESRSMGAKFLDDADLSSREQCLRLCCETEGCDVFVFEEKNQGTCFLFQCGPPENFRCKFTRHVNYTSAVLSTPPTPAPPQPLINQQILINPQTPAPPQLSQHEQELVNLKGKMSKNNPSVTSTTPIPPLGVRLGGEEVTISAITTPKAVLSPKCSRYQFPCHSGECIAIYNACDGIPQCEDGSDEGLECPTPAPKNTNNQLPQLQNQRIFPAANDQILSIPQQQQPQMQIPIRTPAAIHNREDPISVQKPWPKTVPNDVQSTYLDSTDSRFYNRKTNLQLPSNNISPMQYPENIQDANYGPLVRNPFIQSPLVDQYRPQLQQQPQPWLPQQRMDWPQQQMLPQDPPNGIKTLDPASNGIDYMPQQIQQQPVNMQQSFSQNIPVLPPQKPWPLMNATSNVDNSDKSIQQNGSDDKKTNGEKTNKDEYQEDSEEEYPEVEEEPPKKKPHKHRKNHDEKNEKSNRKKEKTKKKEKAQENMDHSSDFKAEHLKKIKNELDLEFADHDGHAERPGGAVLSLTLGVIITLALAILVGCRMRVVGRRIRRSGKGSYAHDADFLVNGMYL